MWDYLALVACGVGLILSGTFVFELHRRTRGGWRDNPFGRFLFTRKLLLLCLFAQAILNRVFTWWPGEMLAALLLWMFALHTVLPYRFLLEAQRERDRREKEEHR